MSFVFVFFALSAYLHNLLRALRHLIVNDRRIREISVCLSGTLFLNVVRGEEIMTLYQAKFFYQVFQIYENTKYCITKNEMT